LEMLKTLLNDALVEEEILEIRKYL
jgi:hypothetical protein